MGCKISFGKLVKFHHLFYIFLLDPFLQRKSYQKASVENTEIYFFLQLFFLWCRQIFYVSRPAKHLTTNKSLFFFVHITWQGEKWNKKRCEEGRKKGARLNHITFWAKKKRKRCHVTWFYFYHVHIEKVDAVHIVQLFVKKK